MFSAFTSNKALASMLANLVSLLAVLLVAALWFRSRHLAGEFEWSLRGFLVINCLAMVAVPHGYYDLSYMLHSFFISVALVRITRSRLDVICAALSFFLAFATMQSRYLLWIIRVAKPLHAPLLVPIYSYLLTICVVAAYIGLRRYVLSNTGKAVVRLQIAPPVPNAFTDTSKG